MRGRLIAADGNVCLLMLMLCEGSSGEIPAAYFRLKQKENNSNNRQKGPIVCCLDTRAEMALRHL